MTSRQSRLDAEKLQIIGQLRSRERSVSPLLGLYHSRSPLTQPDDADICADLKWSITNHDPLERLAQADVTDKDNLDWENDPSEEEQISDDENGEKFRYDDTDNILPNYACRDDQMDQVSSILEHSNLNDRNTIQQLEMLTAGERAVANARNIGTPIDEEVLAKLSGEKQKLTGKDSLDLDKLDQDQEQRRHKLEEYQTYRRQVLQENGHVAAGVASPDRAKSPNKEFMVPYTSAVEDKLDSEFALRLNETIEEGEVDLNKQNSRVIQTITRGNFFSLIDPTVKPKMFLVCMDFSPESIFALEWCLGTVLVDGLVLFLVCVVEENDNNHHLKGSTNETARETHRLNMLTRAKTQVLNLLKLTKLQIHIVIEIVHHPIPRHLISELIENLQPTLVVVGSRGQSALNGVLLGSLSNYLVTKSSVPVMVVREKLKKINRFKSGSLVFSNNIKPLTLSEARVD